MLVEGLGFALQPGVINFTNSMAEAYIEMINTNLSRARMARDLEEKNRLLHNANVGLNNLVKELDERLQITQKSLVQQTSNADLLREMKSEDAKYSMHTRNLADARLQAALQLIALETEAAKKNKTWEMDFVSNSHFYRSVDRSTGGVFKMPMTKREYIYTSFTIRNYIFGNMNGQPKDEGLEKWRMEQLVKYNVGDQKNDTSFALQVREPEKFLELEPEWSIWRIQRPLVRAGSPTFMKDGKEYPAVQK